MKKLILTICIFLTCFVKGQTSYTWTGANNNNFSDAGNWTPGGGPPTAIDDVEFNSTYLINCTLDQASNDVNNFSVTAGYTGIISNPSGNGITINGNLAQAGGSLDIGAGSCSISGSLNVSSSGTFAASSGVLDVSAGTSAFSGVFNGGSATVNFGGEVSLTAGSFTASSGTITFYDDFSFSGGTFTHNSGTVIFTVASGETITLSGAPTFNILTVNVDGAFNVQRNFNFGSSTTAILNLTQGTKRFSYQGAVSVTNSLSLSGSDAGTPTGNTGTFTFNGTNGFISSSSAANQAKLANITVNTAGTFSMSGNISLTGTFLNTNIGTFASNGSTVNFYGSSGLITGGTTATTRAYFDNLVVASSAVVGITGSSQIELAGTALTINGTLNANTSVIRFLGVTNIGGSTSSTTLNAIKYLTAGTANINTTITVLDFVEPGPVDLVTNDNLTIHSSSTISGRLGEITAGGSVTGNVKIRAYAPGTTTGWTNMCGHGVPSTVGDWQASFPLTCYGCTDDESSAGGHFVSVQSWNEAAVAGSTVQYVEELVGTSVSGGLGMWVFLGTGKVTTSAITISLTGVPIQGDVPISITNSGVGFGDGWNLIGNPYASPISWSALLNGNTVVDDAIYIYNPDVGQTSWVSGMGVGAPTGANNVIPMGQAFYVHCTTNTVLTAKESYKVSNNTVAGNPLLKTAVNTGKKMYLKLTGPYDFSETGIRLHPGATNLFDKSLDAYQIFSTPGYLGYPGPWTKNTSISSRIGDVDYSINSVPEIAGKNIVIPILAKVYASGQHTITPRGIEELPSDACVTLKDKVTGITHDLRTGPYMCNINDTTSAPRFELTICSSLAQPIGVKEQQELESSIKIRQDKSSAYLDLAFETPTDATISVVNILGATILTQKRANVTSETVRLDLNEASGLLFITVETGNSKVTKKIVR